MEFEIRKYGFVADRIMELKSTPMDKYLQLHPEALSESYSSRVRKHIEKRSFQRKVREILSLQLAH
jgi:hypothetical protein